MPKKYELRSKETIETINQLLNNNIQRISVLIRHSERFFSKEARREPFMGLTENGKGFAFDFGTALGSNLIPRLCSSFIGRCIETAFLIDKGFTFKNRRDLAHNCLEDMLSPFYVKDVEKAIPMIEELGNTLFIRNWFDSRMDESIMENPKKTADILSEFMVEQIKKQDQNQITVCVSHDWNIFPLKEFKLGLKHEISGDIGYLDGIIFFEKKNQFYITSYQAAPVIL